MIAAFHFRNSTKKLFKIFLWWLIEFCQWYFPHELNQIQYALGHRQEKNFLLENQMRFFFNDIFQHFFFIYLILFCTLE